MLLELVVENYAVVERLRVRFHPGLNLLTGETGSGKSIVVDALGLLLGARASADMVRTGEARTRVAGIFDVHDHAPIRRLLEPAGLEAEDGELLIERESAKSWVSRSIIRWTTKWSTRNTSFRRGGWLDRSHPSAAVFSGSVRPCWLRGGGARPIGPEERELSQLRGQAHREQTSPRSRPLRPSWRAIRWPNRTETNE